MMTLIALLLATIIFAYWIIAHRTYKGILADSFKDPMIIYDIMRGYATYAQVRRNTFWIALTWPRLISKAIQAYTDKQ